MTDVVVSVVNTTIKYNRSREEGTVAIYFLERNCIDKVTRISSIVDRLPGYNILSLTNRGIN